MTTDRHADLVAIDLGSNSFHMVRVQHRDGELLTRYKDKVRVRLAAGLDDRGYLDEDSMRRGLAALMRFESQVAGLPGKNVRVVATHTLRVAKNAHEFLTRAAAVFPHPIEIVSGPQEASLTYAGVAYGHAIDAQATVVDIGGGSTEFAQGVGSQVDSVASCAMGCVVYSERFFGAGQASARGFELARIEAKLALDSVADQFGHSGRVIGSSGTIKACAQLLSAIQGSPLITAEGLSALETLLSSEAPDRISEQFGVSVERCEVLPAGVAILQAIFETFDISVMEFSHVALREGVLLSMVPAHDGTRVRTEARRQLLRRFKVDQRQAKRVVSAVTALLDGLGVEDERVRDLTLDAARFHELGQAIQYGGYQHHGAYVLRYADMAGYPPADRECIAALVAAHRKKIVDPSSIAEPFRLALVALRIGVLSQSTRVEGTEVPPIKRTGDGIEVSVKSDSGPLVAADIVREAKYLSALGLVLVAS